MKTNNTKIKNGSGKTVFKSLALAGLMLGFLSFITNSAQAQGAFVCRDAQLFQSSGSGGSAPPITLSEYDYSVNPFVKTDIGDNSHGVHYNGIGYNALDNYIYGINNTPGSRLRVLRIGNDGVPVDLGPPTPAFTDDPGTRNSDYLSGDVAEGFLYLLKRDVSTAPANIMHRIDLSDLSRIEIPLVDVDDNTIRVITNDIAYDPTSVEKTFYGVVHVGDNAGKLFTITLDDDNNPTKGTVEFIGDNNTSSLFGAMYADNTGKIFGIRNEGGFFQFNKANGVRTLISGTDPVTFNDGAFCADAPLELETELSVEKVVIDVFEAASGETVQFEVLVENIGAFGTSDVVVIDNVPAGIPAGNVSYFATVTGGATTTVSEDPFNPDIGTINDLVDMPAASTITYTITIVIPDNFAGTLENCADVTYEFGDIQDCADIPVYKRTVEITGTCWRMLSSPEIDLTYEDLLSPLGITSAAFPTGYDYHHTWPIGETVFDPDAQWQDVTDLTEIIPQGEGFIISTPVGLPYPIELEVTGTEHAPFLFTHSGNELGWILLGNPFQSFIDLQTLFNQPNTNGLVEAAYVWDPAPPAGYRAWTPTMSEILDGRISPFQGFFVEKSDGTSNVDFNNNVKGFPGGQFYGKQVIDNTFWLNISGGGLESSLGLHFSEEGSFEKTRGDAYELQPLSSEYVTISAVKTDNLLYTISHFPIPNQEFEIPVSINITEAGNYTITSSDFNMSLNENLYFNDLSEGVSILIDENFNYDFSSNQLAKVEKDIYGCAVNSGIQKAVASGLSGRFVISTSPLETAVELPDEIALMQNYPNPFNPSTVIEYNLPEQSEVSLAIYDMLGRRIATLVNETQAAGRYQVSWDANGVSSGSYLYRLEAGGKTITRQMTFIK